jgi:GTP-binding protein EngB required for normal cell division
VETDGRELPRSPARAGSWLETKQIPYVVAATKSDKLNANARARSERNMLAGFGNGGVAERPVLVSVRSGTGLRRLWRHVDAALDWWWNNVGARPGASGPASV